MWLFLAFGSALFAGITAILAKIGIKDVDSNLATGIRTIIVLIFSWFMVFLVDSFETITAINGDSLCFLILSGCATGASWLCYFKAIQLGDVNKVTPIDKSSTIITMILAFVLLGEPIGITKLVGMLAILVGTYMMITKKETEVKTIDRKWMFYAAGSALFASLTAILGKIGISGVESNLGTAIRTVVVLVMSWIVVFVSGSQKGIRKIDKKSWLFICLSGITTGMSWLCYYAALKMGEASIVVPIDKLSILVTVAFSGIVLKEHLSKKAAVGLVFITAGTLFLLV